MSAHSANAFNAMADAYGSTLRPLCPIGIETSLDKAIRTVTAMVRVDDQPAYLLLDLPGDLNMYETMLQGQTWSAYTKAELALIQQGRRACDAWLGPAARRLPLRAPPAVPECQNPEIIMTLWCKADDELHRLARSAGLACIAYAPHHPDKQALLVYSTRSGTRARQPRAPMAEQPATMASVLARIRPADPPSSSSSSGSDDDEAAEAPVAAPVATVAPVAVPAATKKAAPAVATDVDAEHAVTKKVKAVVAAAATDATDIAVDATKQAAAAATDVDLEATRLKKAVTKKAKAVVKDVDADVAEADVAVKRVTRAAAKKAKAVVKDVDADAAEAAVDVKRVTRAAAKKAKAVAKDVEADVAVAAKDVERDASRAAAELDKGATAVAADASAELTKAADAVRADAAASQSLFTRQAALAQQILGQRA